uniref:Uncharacterized protein n=1 Tax=Arundo donax TaxID=35708 RepID=A0A0A9FYT9_ARUDO
MLESTVVDHVWIYCNIQKLLHPLMGMKPIHFSRNRSFT